MFIDEGYSLAFDPRYPSMREGLEPILYIRQWLTIANF